MSSRGILAAIKGATGATMEVHPLLQAGVGALLLIVTPTVSSQFAVGPRTLGTLIGAAGTLGGIVLLITGVARGLLRWVDAESYSDASTGQQMFVLAVGTLLVLGVPLTALIAYIAITG
jgi:hypothetical protein